MRISEIDYKGYKKQINDPESSFNRSLKTTLANQAEWVEFEGVNVLRVNQSNFVAVPCNGRKNSAYFDVIDITDRTDIVCQLNKKEVFGWLCKRAISELK